MNQKQCVERALLFIEEHLKTPIALEDIADAANYSQWYFHRLFRVLTGYSVIDYLRKRRLYEASYELLYTPKSIRKIAEEYQFESQSAFTRSFSSLCGISPGRFRRQMPPLFRFPALSLDNSYKHLKKGVKDMNAVFKHKESFTVMGVFTKSSPNATLHKLWEDFSQRVGEIPNVSESDKAYQVCVFDPANPDPEEYTFIAGMRVGDGASPAKDMMLHTVPAADYAVFEHHGTMDKMHKTYEYIFGVWMQENAYQMAESDNLEVYDERFKVNQEDSIFEIWIPVKPA